MRMSPLLLVAAGLLLAGCSKENSAKKPDDSASGNPITAPVDYLGAVAKAKRIAEKTIDSTSLNQTIQLFYAQEDRFPKELNELVAKQYIPRLPPPPAGMRYAYNPKNGEIKVVAQQ